MLSSVSTSTSVSASTEAKRTRSSAPISSISIATSSPTSQKSFFKRHEVPRKVFHSLTGFFTVWLLVNDYNPKQLVVPLIAMTILCLGQEFLRLTSPKFNEFCIRHYGFMMRTSEFHQINGIFYFLIGLLFNSYFLPKDLVVLANFFLSWGDTMASMAGREFGKYTPKIGSHKSLAGCIANFFTGMACCYLLYGYLIPTYQGYGNIASDIWYNPKESRLSLVGFAVIGGLISSVSEIIEGVDDNLTIPVISGVVMYGVVNIFKTGA
jgi:diacylglycerol kinase (CTP)